MWDAGLLHCQLSLESIQLGFVEAFPGTLNNLLRFDQHS